MPVRRAESLTTLMVQCRAPNSLAGSRHQACLVSVTQLCLCPHTLSRDFTSRRVIIAASIVMSISYPIRHSHYSSPPGSLTPHRRGTPDKPGKPI